MIVDDEPSIAESLQDLLESNDYFVVKALNGVEGLKILAAYPIDLVILDLNMPRMDGYMFMEHLKTRLEKSNKKSAAPKILVMTAVDKKTDLGLADNLGATAYVNKPFSNADLLATIRRLI